MAAHELILLSPYRYPGANALTLAREDMACWLNGHSLLWHPALLWQAMPTATVAQIENAIYGSCSIGTMPRDRANRGLPNAVKAFQLLTGTPLPTSAPKPARPGRARKPAKKAKLKTARRTVRSTTRKVARRKRRAA